MNRRKFIQSMAAAFTLPAAPALLKPAVAALPAAAPSAAAQAALATKARFWAIYMYGLHGNCTPATLSTIIGVPEVQARGYLTNLVADGTIRPHALLRKTMTKVVEKSVKGPMKDLGTREEGDGVLEKAEEYVGWQWEDEGEEETEVDEKATVAIADEQCADDL